MLRPTAVCGTVGGMIRGFLLGLVIVTAACGQKSNASLCVAQVPPPAACNVDCDPAPGAQNSCPAGYHCSPDGKCDLFCLPGGSECGNGYSCTADGRCVKGDVPPLDAGPDTNCPAIEFSATRITPSIQLLVDRSTSMQENFDGQDPPAPGPYKYAEMTSALVGPQGVVTQLESAAFFGATLYTAVRSETCPSLRSAPRMRNNKDAIARLLAMNPPPPERNENAGFTPTHLAIDAAVDEFLRNPPPQDSPPIIVLATDGIPNECTTTSPREAESVAAAANAFRNGIKLFILGIDIQSAAAHIQAVANAGQGVQPGQPNATPFFANNPTELANAFQTIIGGAVSCDLTLDREIDPAEADKGTVTLNGMTLTFGTEWTVDTDGRTLHLLGNACTVLKSSPNPDLDAAFPCGVVIL